MNSFTKNLANLTNRQREAVEYTEGPLLVIAGPGTGKTQLLSMRVAQILKTTDVDASNILCLTFTNKASSNMRSRLQELIGPESIGVNVKTFHSLSAEIMNEYPDYFWNGANLVTAPDVVQTDIVESILHRLPLDNPLAVKFAGNFTSIKRVQNALKLAKEAGLTPEKLKAIINYNLKYIDSIEQQFVEALPSRLSIKVLDKLQSDIAKLAEHSIDESIKPLMSLSTNIIESLDEAIKLDIDTGKTKNVSTWRGKYIQSEAGIKGMHRQRRSNLWWLNLADVYDQYRQELHKRGYYDYADMLIEVISQLETSPSMLSDIQERYHYIMIDEFQDSNSAQMRLAHQIASHPLDGGSPNLMVVGDDDQSIFKFNGAELNNMLRFREMYPTTKTIVLEDNFRSSQAVLDLSRKIIELANDRLVKRDNHISKDLVARNEPRQKGKLVHRTFATREQQLYEVAKDISDSFNKDTNNTIAVLARRHESLEIIASLLNKQAVPINYERQNNILDNPAIKQVIDICRILRGIRDGDEVIVNQSISEVIRHEMWDIKPLELWRLAVDNRYEAKWLDSLLDSDNQQLKSIGNWLLKLSQLSAEYRIEIIIDYILGLRQTEEFVSPIRNYYIHSKKLESEYVETLSAIQKLRGAVDEIKANDQASFDEFLNFVDTHIENNINITDESAFITSDSAIQLLTVHKAKGLEFDTVYVVDCIEKQWQPKAGGLSTPINLPLQPYGDDIDDYVRLMYVATTRAKHSVIATSYRHDSAGEDIVSTPLIADALPRLDIEPVDEPAKAIEILESSITWPSLKNDDARMILKPILDNFSLNVTGLMNFLDITRGGPSFFLERNLLRLPGARTISLAFGTAIHSSLELAQRQINRGEFDPEYIKSYFESELQKEAIMPEELDRWKPYGIELLSHLFDEQLLTLPEGGTPEQRLIGINIGDATLDGKLDHIIVDDISKEILITDYKTGTPLKAFTSRDKSLQIKLWKHKTQLIFYALLASNHPLYKNMNITCRMQYLEAKTNNAQEINREYTPSLDEIERLSKLSQAVYKKITNYDLPDISNYSQDIDGILHFEEDLIAGI